MAALMSKDVGIQAALALPMPPEVESQSSQATRLQEASKLGVVVFATDEPVADNYRRIGRPNRWQIQMPGQGQAIAFKVDLLPLQCTPSTILPPVAVRW